MVRRLTSLLLSVIVVVSQATGVVEAQPAPQGTEPEAALDKKIAVWRFDALGIQPELVSQLETLFRNELARLSKIPPASRRDIERAVTTDQQQCTGEEKCLAAIGKKLGVDVVVTGTVGALGTNYVLNIKAVDIATGKQLQRIQSDPLRGSPDDLIEGVRVAAYKLLAPEQLHGSLQVQTDIVGAEVRIDDKAMGKTPMPNQGVMSKLALGKHKLRVKAPGYDPFEDEITVNFQKVSQVEVRLLLSKDILGTGKFRQVERKPFYTHPIFVGGVFLTAILVGALVGKAIGEPTCINGMMPEMEIPCR